ncbi:MAG: DUF3570 domain-containing protein [Granulosicoccus sp.]
MSALNNTLALAAVSLVAAGNAKAENNWNTDVSFLSYNESQERVSVSKTIWDLTHLTDDQSTTVQLVYDTMSGASPTGAIRGSEGSVTYTGPSGGSGFSTSGQGDTAAATFTDTRTQLGIDQERELNRAHTLSYGAVYSTESDYESFGGSVGLTRESASKNTTLDIGFAATFDTISRSFAQGTPAPLTTTSTSRDFSDGQRNTTDIAVGLTQVLNRSTLAQLTLSLSQSQGYHTDPYKVISAADDSDRVLENYTESRPDSRQRTSVYAKIVHQLNDTKNSIHLGYRLYNDDWGIQSNTVDARYHHQLTPKQFIEPHVRFYQQTEADFYQRKLNVDDNLRTILPEDGFVSADYRLDAMSSITVGAKYGLALSSNTKLRFRAAYLQQQFSTAEFDSNTAVIVQSSVSYKF